MTSLYHLAPWRYPLAPLSLPSVSPLAPLTAAGAPNGCTGALLGDTRLGTRHPPCVAATAVEQWRPRVTQLMEELEQTLLGRSRCVRGRVLQTCLWSVVRVDTVTDVVNFVFSCDISFLVQRCLISPYILYYVVLAVGIVSFALVPLQLWPCAMCS